jgi:hypothetical protein
MRKKVISVLASVTAGYALLLLVGAGLFAKQAPGSGAQVAGAVILLCTGWVHGEDVRFVLSAAKLRLRDPENEASRALAAGDARFIAVVGVYPFAPASGRGLNGKSVEAREFCGEGDTPHGLSHLYQAACYDFARRYNDKILEGQRLGGAAPNTGPQPDGTADAAPRG